MPNLMSKEHLGLLFEYATVGLVYGLLPETIYPFMQQYLNCSGSQVAAAKQLVVLPWSFKVFYGILSDCRPIFGYRRRPYMLIGWTICIIMLLVMAIMPIGKPYYTVASDRDVAVADYTDEIRARINYDAPSEGAKYVIIMFFAAFGYVMADVCADSITVELAQREPIDKRGKTQSCIYTVRTVMVIFGELLTGFFFNGEEYGGDFDFSLSFPQLMIIVTVLSLPVLPMTWYFIKEEKVERADFKEYISGFWNLLCCRAVYQVIAYNFFANIFADFTYTASTPVASYMVDVTPINSTVSDILSNLLFMFGIMITSKWGLHWNWRWMIVCTAATVIVADCAVAMIVVWDIFRNQWFWLGPPIVVQLPYGVGWIISTFVTVELAQLGNEAAVYGLITTVTNVAAPFATSLTLLVDGPFNITNDRVKEDDHSVRMDITYTIIIMYAAMVFAWVFLFLLPKQKEDAQRILREGGKSKILGGVTVAYLTFAIIWSILTNVLAIFDIAAAKQLVILPWSFKVFYGILSDCRPIFGYRRRPYMLIGWTICIAMLLIMAIMPIGKPYYTVASDRDVAVADYTDEIRARINYDAPSEGAKYVIIMLFAACGYVLSDVCADSITCELAQQEPIDKRGKTQSAIYVVRTALVIFGELLTGFCFNGEDYGGDFNFSLSFPQLMIIVTVLSLPVLPMTWYFIHEEKSEPANFRQYINDFWDLMCSRAVYQVIAYNFFAGIFNTITYTASSPVASYMVDVTPINSTVSDILSNLLFMAGIMITSKWGLHWNWRWMILATGAVVIVVDCAVAMMVVWDVFRNQWFWLGPPIVVQLPYGVGWIISTYVVVELAQVGNEAAVYGLITTVSNVAQPFATSLTLLMDGPFDITNDRVKEDDHSVRMDITYTIIIMYSCMAFSWVFLYWLPKQKEETQELLRKGGHSKLIGGITVFYLVFAIIWSIMTNIMAIFDSTSCLIIAGGTGC
ncbi:Glyceraldehyde-3-phosphate dehydrogenase [Phytophthora nicotianae]|uniref:Glyceraldehyde-3-phosphate dehydrogenase n=2 Tax=Phytophthora nicotianae TaxID=4792 RepID=A0A0W8CWP5_PHYNI|nr:Glyceraldehyde-3-phosphate dehydrogenase [Phytophthora nicotianae]